MHEQLDSVTSNLTRTNQQLSALGSLESLKSEMPELDENIVAMCGLMGPFPDTARSVSALNGQIESLGRTIVTLQGETAGSLGVGEHPADERRTPQHHRAHGRDEPKRGRDQWERRPTWRVRSGRCSAISASSRPTWPT
ncbi:hypothetical protein [Saccharopolyspora halophila]|uniref:hypothetical protein n=1 Tax=Saccharopolyspora halophila TaxID=405551 RepID=UPI0031CDC780